MKCGTDRVVDVTRAILIALIVSIGAAFLFRGSTAEGLACAALAVANIATWQASNAEKRINECLEIDDEILRVMGKALREKDSLDASPSEPHGPGGLNERD